MTVGFWGFGTPKTPKPRLIIKSSYDFHQTKAEKQALKVSSRRRVSEQERHHKKTKKCGADNKKEKTKPRDPVR